MKKQRIKSDTHSNFRSKKQLKPFPLTSPFLQFNRCNNERHALKILLAGITRVSVLYAGKDIIGAPDALLFSN